MEQNHPSPEDLQLLITQAIITACNVSRARSSTATKEREPTFQEAFANRINEKGRTKDGLQCIEADVYETGTNLEQRTGADIELFWRSSPTEKTICYLQVKMVYKNKKTYDQAIAKDKLTGMQDAYVPYFALNAKSTVTKQYQAVTLSDFVSNCVKAARAKPVEDLQPGFNLYDAVPRHFMGGYLLVNNCEWHKETKLILLHRIGDFLGGITPDIMDKLKPEKVTKLYTLNVLPRYLPTFTEVEEKSALNNFLPT